MNNETMMEYKILVQWKWMEEADTCSQSHLLLYISLAMLSNKLVRSIENIFSGT